MAVPFTRGLTGVTEHETDLSPAPAVLAGSGDRLVDLTLLVSQPAQGQANPPQVERILGGRRRGIERVQPGLGLDGSTSAPSTTGAPSRPDAMDGEARA